MKGLPIIALTTCLGLWGPPAVAEPEEGTVKPTPAPLNKRPAPPRTWVDGPEVSDRAAARKWLDARGPGARVRLPVAILRGPLGGVSAATVVGVTPDPAAGAGDPLVLDLDDGRLGISLAERLRTLCPDGSRPCAVWLEGQWRAGLAPAIKAAGVPFAVTHVGPTVSSHPNAPPRVARIATEVPAKPAPARPATP